MSEYEMWTNGTPVPAKQKTQGQRVVKHPVSETLPKGLYCGIRISNDIFNVPWKLDLWALPNIVISQQKKEMLSIKSKLDKTNRKLILNVKESLLNNDNRTPMGSGYYIYQAVLNHHLYKKQDIIDYLVDKNIKI